MASTTTLLVVEDPDFIQLYRAALIPLYVSLSSLVCVLQDYFITVENEINYIWPQRMNFAKAMFLWIRYYTIILLVLDVIQAHAYSRPSPATHTLCLLLNPISGMAGALSLWSVEIVMQLRVYVLFNRSKRLAGFNGALFIASVGFFLWLLVSDTLRRSKHMSLPTTAHFLGCHPTLNKGLQWELWLPATVFELVLFVQVLYKSICSTSARIRLNKRISLAMFLLHDSLMYFFVVAWLLVMNMVIIGSNRIPWTGFGLFHAGIGIGTSRMMIEIRVFSARNLEWAREKSKMSCLHFQTMLQENRPDLEVHPEVDDEEISPHFGLEQSNQDLESAHDDGWLAALPFNTDSDTDSELDHTRYPTRPQPLSSTI
ncbi:hypothetical protein BJ165DRAFT_1057008 [Panaeolus papilionaceus]|nr:hypothetical protein BJ165DRAFT_1057008 [Panaeolus papilionaceus]